MKKLFEIDSEEVKRILKLHESAAKRHYLNEEGGALVGIGSQDYPTTPNQTNTNKTKTKPIQSYTTNNNLTFEQDRSFMNYVDGAGNELKLFKGATFTQSKGNPKFLVSVNAVFQFVDTMSGQLVSSWDSFGSVIPADPKKSTFYGAKGDYLYYGCETGKFTTKAARKGTQSVLFYAEDGASVGLVNILRNVCAYKTPENNQNQNNQSQNNQQKKLTPEEKLKKANGCGFKTWEEYQNSGWKCTPKQEDKIVQPKPKTIKLNPSEEEKCQLLGDKTWSYAKQKDRWFATKDGVNWYEITNNKKAVAILTDPTKGCKNIKELVAFVPPPVADVDFSQVPVEPQKQVTTAKTNVAPDQDNEERPV